MPENQCKCQTDDSEKNSSSGESHIHHSDTYVHCHYVLNRNAIIRYAVYLKTNLRNSDSQK